jgi:O-antigen ligase
MRAKLKSFSDLLVNRILPVFNVFIFFLVIYDALVKIMYWDLVIPALENDIHRLLRLVSLSQVKVQLDTSYLSILGARFLLIACLLILLVENKTVRRIRFWLVSLPFLGIMALSALSRIWSVSVPMSQTRYLYFAAAAVGGIYIGLECNHTKIIRLFEAFSVLVLLANLFAVYREPALAIMHGPGVEGAWRGVLWWKSYAGEIEAFAAILFLIRVVSFKHNRWYVTLYGLVFYALSVYLLIRAKSATELLALIAAHAVVVLLLFYLRWGHLLRRIHWVGLGFAGLILLLGLWYKRNSIFRLLGKNSDLTGRLPLWNALIPFIRSRFLLGYGYGEAFWKVKAYTQVVWAAAGWKAPFSHNGFIEVLVGTGIVGLVVWIVFILQDTWLSLRYLARQQVISASVFSAWIAYIVVSNLADNMLGSYEYFTWFLLTVTFAFLIRERLEAPQARPMEAVQTQ